MPCYPLWEKVTRTSNQTINQPILVGLKIRIRRKIRLVENSEKDSEKVNQIGCGCRRNSKANPQQHAAKSQAYQIESTGQENAQPLD